MKRIISALTLNVLLVATTFAQAYGEGSYGSAAYAGSAPAASDNIQIGPITLPVTGPQLAWGFVGITLISIAVVLLHYARQRRSARTI